MLLERLARWLTERRRDDLGARGERAAAAYLRRKGYRVLEMNWRCRLGEADLICRDPDGKVLVIVEVKSRECDVVTPEEQVNAFKERQVGRVAAVYCQRFGDTPPPVRFDIVAVVWPAGEHPTIRHHIDAFVPPG